jgi:hypothetical protein
MSEPPDLEALARRYLDLWQSQVNAIAGDTELSEALARFVEAAKAMGAGAWWPGAAAQPEASSREKHGTDSPPADRSAAAAASPGDRDDDLAGIGRRLDALERRLAVLESKGKPSKARAVARGKPAVASRPQRARKGAGKRPKRGR